MRWLTGSTPKVEDKADLTPVSELDQILAKEGNKKLYYGSQAMTIRAMLAVAGVNLVYWGSQATQYFMYKGVVAHGIDLSVHPMWAAFGVTLTVAVSFFTRTFAHSAVLQAYETADGKRIGVQTHTILGFPGQKIEFPIGSAQLFEPKEKYIDPNQEQPSGVKNMFFATSQIPVKLPGHKTNLVLDKKGTYFENFRLLDLMSASAATDALKLDKAERINWKKDFRSKNSNKKQEN